jgi:hypothetical protein
VVKSYAMVSVKRVGDAVRSEDDANPDLEACLKAYVNKVNSSTDKILNIDYNAVLPDSIAGGESSGESAPSTPAEIKSITGVISDIRTAVVNGNSVYYIALDGNKVYYSIAAAEAENVVILNKGDTVTVTYKTAEGNIVDAKSVK